MTVKFNGGDALRHRCRNPRCRLKLPEPVENVKAAFCKRGRFDQFHRRRCVVCEREYERTAEHQRVCRRRKCRAELRRWTARYVPFGVKSDNPPSDVISPLRKRVKPGTFFRTRDGRGFEWIRLTGEDADWQLLDREGKQVARIRQEGSGYWVARPRAIPEPAIESIDDAKRRAVHLVLASLPLDPQTATRVARINRVAAASIWRDWPADDAVAS
jgi:hypothetical protein